MIDLGTVNAIYVFDCNGESSLVTIFVESNQQVKFDDVNVIV